MQWNDIDAMERHNDFTYDKNTYKDLPLFVDQVHKLGMHYVQIFDPAISGTEPPGTYPPLDDGLAMDIFIRNGSGQLFYGKVWNDVNSLFPDFTHPNVTTWWAIQARRYLNEIKVDGTWLDSELIVFNCKYPPNYFV